MRKLNYNLSNVRETLVVPNLCVLKMNANFTVRFPQVCKNLLFFPTAVRITRTVVMLGFQFIVHLKAKSVGHALQIIIICFSQHGCHGDAK